MVENLEEFNLEIGTEETQKLKPTKVDIKEIEIIEGVKDGRKWKKLVCKVKHPDSQDLIQISSIEWINPNTKKVETAGLFLNKDSEGKIRKNSSIAILLNKLNCKTINELHSKTAIETVSGSSGFLVFKCY